MCVCVSGLGRERQKNVSHTLTVCGGGGHMYMVVAGRAVVVMRGDRRTGKDKYLLKYTCPDRRPAGRLLYNIIMWTLANVLTPRVIIIITT